MQFAQPLFLWAITAISIPIAIHLLSRKEGKVIKMGSLRHLRETSTKQFKGIKLNEYLLLTLRCLLIVLFALILSGLYWDREDKKWIVVEKELEESPLTRKLIDSLERNGFEFHWLQKDFPIESNKGSYSSIDYWEAIALLQQKGINEVVVLSTTEIKNFKGERKYIPPTIRWITIPNQPTNFISSAIPQNSDQWLLRVGHSQEDYTSFETITKPANSGDTFKLAEVDTLKITLVTDVDFEQEKKIIQAALSAIAHSLPIIVVVKELNSQENISKTDWVIWISKSNPDFDSQNIIIYKPQVFNQLFEHVNTHTWNLTQKLTVDYARTSNLTVQLAALLINEKSKWAQISLEDRRVLPDSLLRRGYKQFSSAQIITDEWTPNSWLLLLLISLFLIERLFSYHKNQ